MSSGILFCGTAFRCPACRFDLFRSERDVVVPGRKLSFGGFAAELAHRAFGDAVVEGQRNLGMDDVETARQVAASRAKCQAVIDDEGASELEREEARAELEEIQEWARKHLRGTEGKEQRQVRAIRQCIRRLLEKLRAARTAEGEPDGVLRAFGEHLERYLWRPSGGGVSGRSSRVRSGLAGRFTYEPPTGVRWSG